MSQRRRKGDRRAAVNRVNRMSSSESTCPVELDAISSQFYFVERVRVPLKGTFLA